MIKVLHAPICIYSAEGDIIQCLEENNGKKLIEKEDFSIEISKTIPCIYVKENGVAFCLMWVQEEGYFLGLGKIRISAQFLSFLCNPFFLCKAAVMIAIEYTSEA